MDVPGHSCNELAPVILRPKSVHFEDMKGKTSPGGRSTELKRVDSLCSANDIYTCASEWRCFCNEACATNSPESDPAHGVIVFFAVEAAAV